MKIKHWQGYGSVNAVKTSEDKYHVEIVVTGAHEYGLLTTDHYFIRTWLLAKVAKKWMGIPSHMLDIFAYEERYDKVIYTIRPRFGMTLKQAEMAC